jgi:RNA polymerase sigma-70 factor (ECF subfamily)
VLATLTAETETGLVEQACRGDRSAFGELVRHHHPGLVNVVYRMCGDAQLAEDAAQEAFLRAWLNLPSFRPGSSLRNWLYRIAVNAALDSLRRERRTPQDLETVPAADPEPGPESRLVRSERAERVQQAILSLSEANRAVVVLREYGGLSYQEISAALDIPAGTVMSRLNYARNRLREILADLEDDHD